MQIGSSLERTASMSDLTQIGMRLPPCAPWRPPGRPSRYGFLASAGYPTRDQVDSGRDFGPDLAREAFLMSDKNRAATVARHLDQSREKNDYATPYGLVAGNLRTQNAKARANAVDLLVEELGLQEFDAETIARSVADLSQLKEATRTARKRRYGQYEIKFIEVDVVTWRILPSLENIRFEGDRA